MSYNGEALTYKLRKDLFAKYLRMPISFYDEKENNTGALTNHLSGEIQTVNVLASSVLNFYLIIRS